MFIIEKIHYNKNQRGHLHLVWDSLDEMFLTSPCKRVAPKFILMWPVCDVKANVFSCHMSWQWPCPGRNQQPLGYLPNTRISRQRFIVQQQTPISIMDDTLLMSSFLPRKRLSRDDITQIFKKICCLARNGFDFVVSWCSFAEIIIAWCCVTGTFVSEHVYAWTIRYANLASGRVDV